MVAILAVGMASPARADLEISIGGNNVTTSSSSLSYKGTVNNLSINMTATDNSAGVGVSSATITNVSKTSSVTFDILVSANNFAAPTHAFNVLSSVNGTGTPNSFSFTSYVNNSNTLDAKSGSHSGSQGLNSSMLFSANLNVKKYSMTEDFHVVLGKGESFKLTNSATTVPNPEPSSMAIAGIGALGLIGYGLRRRKSLGV
jgi:hypothetical protein